MSAATTLTAGAAAARLRVMVRGAVQGVGFRPFVWRLATELGLTGWVANAPSGVVIEAEGPSPSLAAFLERLPCEKPPRAILHGIEQLVLDPVDHVSFEIRESLVGGAAATIVLPDIATCPQCLREVFDPHDRRYRYPFTNCTHCGPRYSIIESLPYDRPRTTMRTFPMCIRCRAEYEDPRDRRFHAQPTACPECGPRLALRDAGGRLLAEQHAALLLAVRAVREGRIAAVKDVGGFHLIVDATNADAVERLRMRKAREEKPFALLYPALTAVRADAEVSPLEELLLTAPEAPIVLLRRRGGAGATAVASAVAPQSPCLGIMLPSNPLQHLLLAELSIPIVATSGNRAEEPLAIDDRAAEEQLSGIADVFLVHDRPIARPVDDSIVSVIAGRAMLLRRARGYAPLPIGLSRAIGPVLAVGAHMKSAVAITVGSDAVISQHLGNLGSAASCERFQTTIGDLCDLSSLRPERVACDLHPDYPSTRFAETLGHEVVRVQHHHAHVLACMAENELDPPVLGVAWDGTGYGLDGTVWGGEFLRVTAQRIERVAHLRSFRLPGGERAVTEPRRAALGVLFELFGEDLPADLAPVRAFTAGERAVLVGMMRKAVHAPITSSAGRLFDAVAALLDLRQRATFEGQAAMALEHAIAGQETADRYAGEPEAAGEGGNPVDWEPIVRGVIADLRRDVPAGRIAAKFHNSLVEMIVSVARLAGEERVALTGGCFQNRYLTERTIRRLREAAFRPYWHQRIPPNDGGIALGQLAAVARM